MDGLCILCVIRNRVEIRHHLHLLSCYNENKETRKRSYCLSLGNEEETEKGLELPSLTPSTAPLT